LTMLYDSLTQFSFPGLCPSSNFSRSTTFRQSALPPSSDKEARTLVDALYRYGTSEWE
jgi:hypothetical protein